MPSVLYASKLTDPLYLVVASRNGVPMFGRPNRLVFYNCNGLVVQYQGCAPVVSLGALVIHIT